LLVLQSAAMMQKPETIKMDSLAKNATGITRLQNNAIFPMERAMSAQAF
jgi:hypothetical protein